MTRKLQVLTFVDYYLPAHKAGGPVRAIANLVAALGSEIDFHIVTRDRDLGDSRPFAGVIRNEWTEVAGTRVFYAAPGMLTPIGIARIAGSVPVDILYLNGIFIRRFALLPLVMRRMGVLPRSPVVVAPRGQLCPGAMKIKSARKNAALSVINAAGLVNHVVWQASTDIEAGDIAERIGSAGGRHSIVVAPEIFEKPSGVHPGPQRDGKKAGSLRVLFLSRISEKKNLHGALQMLKNVRGDVVFNIVGPLEDQNYWAQCEEIAAGLPDNVRVHYQGEVSHEQVGAVMAENDLFLFPTFSENYGYVIPEALAAGCPVLISDQTPWRGLRAANAGWDLPLADPGIFTEALERMVAMTPEEHALMSRDAIAYAHRVTADPGVVEANRRLFHSAASQAE